MWKMKMVQTSGGDMEERLEKVEKMIEDMSISMRALELKQDAAAKELRAWMEEMMMARDNSGVISAATNMELPMFDGTDARAWLGRAEHYFLVHEIKPLQRMKIAAIAMTGAAIPWYQLLVRRIPRIDWETFVEELVIRFGDVSVINVYESLASVKQTGALDDYIAAFENVASQIPDFTDIHYLGFFLGGLKRDLRVQMQDALIKDYTTAIQMARWIDKRFLCREVV